MVRLAGANCAVAVRPHPRGRGLQGDHPHDGQGPRGGPRNGHGLVAEGGVRLS